MNNEQLVSGIVKFSTLLNLIPKDVADAFKGSSVVGLDTFLINLKSSLAGTDVSIKNPNLYKVISSSIDLIRSKLNTGVMA